MKRLQLSMLLLLSLGLMWVVNAMPARADGITLSQTVPAGQTAHYQLELYNETEVAHQYELAISGLPASLTTQFKQAGLVVETVEIGANAFATIAVAVAVPAGADVGHYPALFQATRDDGLAVSLPVTLNVSDAFALRIVSQSLNLTTFNGQAFSFDTTVINDGAAPLTDTMLELAAPDKWIVRTEPASAATIEPGAEMTFRTTVTVPKSQVATDENISLQAVSAETTSPATQLAVRVQNSPTFLYVTVATIVLALLGVAFYFRIKGRR